MRPHIILRYAGLILLFNAVFLFISAAISFFGQDSAFFALMYTALVCVLFGIFPLIYVPPADDISNREGLVIVVASWFISCLVGLIPYILWGGEFTFTNAWFESVSGYTTTGSTILTNVEALPPGLLFWRAATHWIGGVGIIIFALSVIPSMGRVGMILYRSEMAPLAMENFQYRTRRVLQIILFVYVGLTFMETVALLFCGMNLFDAVTHSFSTIATGGFSTKNLSVAYYNSVAVEIVMMIFMVLSGLNFGLLFIAMAGKFKSLTGSSTVRFYMGILTIGILAAALNLHGTFYKSWADAFRYGSFQIITVATDTGFATTDSTIWPPFAQLLLVFFTTQGGCSGSTAGGIKIDRAVLFWHAIRKRFKKLEHPHAIVKVKIGGTIIDDDIVEASLLYTALYIGVVFFSGLLLTAMGVDIVSALSGSAATMANCGPGLGTVGSMGNFNHIPDAGKWVLSANMLLGRLEIFGLLMLFIAKPWK